MALNAIRTITILILSATLIAGSISAATVDSKYELAGLGLHEETGRKIYLGGLYLPKGTSRPQDLMQLTGPMLMEYRVVARRTSIRSLLGGMLLQSEVATGEVPGTATTQLADMVLSNVKTSLYTGDSLMIQSTQGGETVALLNNQELARVEGTAVANYLLMGWVSESGPSALFRSYLMSAAIDPSMLSMLENNQYSAEREAQVAAWFSAEADEETPSTASDGEEIAQAAQSETPTAAPEASKEPADKTPSPAAAVAAVAVAAATESAEGSASIAADSSPATPAVVASIEPAPQPAEASVEVQTAALAPIEEEPQEGDEVLSLGVQEYSRRLSEFHGNVVAMVYREIRYPKRAVRRNLQGRLELDLSLQNNGELVAVSVSQSSGHKLLDNAAVDAAKKAFKSGDALDSIDPVAIAEFSSGDDNMVIPIPVSFKLAED